MSCTSRMYIYTRWSTAKASRSPNMGHFMRHSTPHIQSLQKQIQACIRSVVACSILYSHGQGFSSLSLLFTKRLKSWQGRSADCRILMILTYMTPSGELQKFCCISNRTLTFSDASQPKLSWNLHLPDQRICWRKMTPRSSPGSWLPLMPLLAVSGKCKSCLC